MLWHFHTLWSVKSQSHVSLSPVHSKKSVRHSRATLKLSSCFISQITKVSQRGRARRWNGPVYQYYQKKEAGGKLCKTSLVCYYLVCMCLPQCTEVTKTNEDWKMLGLCCVPDTHRGMCVIYNGGGPSQCISCQGGL